MSIFTLVLLILAPFCFKVWRDHVRWSRQVEIDRVFLHRYLDESARLGIAALSETERDQLVAFVLELVEPEGEP